ncbi:flagellar protein FliT [Pseudoduganella sp. GCM10020061]|uniref:flagellar protein FliT n=1 Tax=Pseudoduganella sp. GCM10020061 TaxID=3317345 RepID=UPI0036341539
MTSQDILSMYEKIAGITAQMAVAAQAGDWDRLALLEGQCKTQAGAAEAGALALTGELRARKVALLKQIMANDRAVREVTEPWHARLAATMAAH